MSDATADAGPSGINGWLLLPALGLVLSPIQAVLLILETVQLLPFTEGWPELRTLLLVEMVVYAGLGVAAAYVAFRFFRRKRETPALFIGLMIAAPALGVGLAVVEALVLGPPVYEAEALPYVAAALAVAGLWIAYMRLSVRVRNTFTR